jgi:anti-sigma regulatory factor (Ser/Thr protein kinase)
MVAYSTRLTRRTGRRPPDCFVKLRFPNSASLHNIVAFIKSIDPSSPEVFELETHNKWVHVHPVVLAMAACAASKTSQMDGQFKGEIPDILSINYLTRMGLFDFVKLQPPRIIREHEEAGRFIPLTQIRSTSELKNAIANLVPLLHAPAEVADPIKYVFSEMVRNAMEHANSSVGAFVAAQYYAESQRIAIGIADAGIGIYEHMRQFHPVETSKCLSEEFLNHMNHL